jgi:SAM-dependent methyltransferase
MSDSIDASPDYLAANRRAWQGFAPDYVEAAKRSWAGEARWGIWGISEADVGILPERLDGQRCIEIGCGTGYVSAWLARRGGLPVGVDLTPNQLATAREMQRQHNLHYPLIEGIGERLPFRDNTFDFAISEYGAALWSDPYLWIPEAARVLRTDGRLVFLTNSPFVAMCAPDDEADHVTPTLLRPYFGLHRTQWADAAGEIEFHLPHGKWIDLLRANGFEIERLLELRAPQDATTRYTWADATWARNWPTEEVWMVRKAR